MRQKVIDYLAKPNAKKRDGLTSMEQKWVDAQLKKDAKKKDGAK